MVKRFLVFAGERYEPFGGCDDYQFSVDNLDEAIKWAEENIKKGIKYNNLKIEWANVFDTQEEKICYKKQ